MFGDRRAGPDRNGDGACAPRPWACRWCSSIPIGRPARNWPWAYPRAQPGGAAGGGRCRQPAHAAVGGDPPDDRSAPAVARHEAGDAADQHLAGAGRRSRCRARGPCARASSPVPRSTCCRSSRRWASEALLVAWRNDDPALANRLILTPHAAFYSRIQPRRSHGANPPRPRSPISIRDGLRDCVNGLDRPDAKRR